jgi:hypothetical protein
MGYLDEDEEDGNVLRLAPAEELVDYEDEARRILLAIATDMREPTQVRIMAAAAILGGRDP